MFVDVFAHVRTSKSEKSKKDLGGSARARFGAPLQGDPEKSGSVPTRKPIFPTQTYAVGYAWVKERKGTYKATFWGRQEPPREAQDENPSFF